MKSCSVNHSPNSFEYVSSSNKVPGAEQIGSEAVHVSNALIPLSDPDFLLVTSSDRQNICHEKSIYIYIYMNRIIMSSKLSILMTIHVDLMILMSPFQLKYIYD